MIHSKTAWIKSRVDRYRQRIEFISKHPNHKAWPRILWEMNSSALPAGCPKSDYILFRLFRKSITNFQGYIPTNTWCEFTDSIAIPELIDIFDDKLQFHETLTESEIRLPNKLGTYKNSEFQITTNGVSITFQKGQTEKALSKLCAQKPSGVFAKPIRGSGGEGAFRLHPNMGADEVLAKLGDTDYLFQDYVQQHPILNEINPKCLNTLRLTTVRDVQNVTHIAAGFLRLGRGTAEVDNAESGGIMNFLDLETGKLDVFGYTTINHGGDTMKRHPDTGVVFGDITLPFYDDIVALVKKASNILPNPVVGWDIAITSDGPVLIEANRRPSVTTDQAIMGPFMKRPKMRELILRFTDGKGL